MCTELGVQKRGMEAEKNFIQKKQIEFKSGNSALGSSLKQPNREIQMGNEVFDDDRGNSLKKHKREKTKKGLSDSDSSEISIDEKLQRKLLKKLQKLKKKKKEKKRAGKDSERKKKKKNKTGKEFERDKKEKKGNETVVSEESKKSKNFTPMTKEEWEKQQNTLRRVYDEETGRTRLIKGTGEIVEECVSKERQLAINKQATLKDGEYFQKILSMKFK